MRSILPTVSSSAAWAYISPERFDLPTLSPTITPAMARSDSRVRRPAAAGEPAAALHFERGGGVDYVQIAQLLRILIQRVAGDKEAQHFFLCLQPLVLIPVGSVGQVVARFCGTVRLASKRPARPAKSPCWPASRSRCACWARSIARSADGHELGPAPEANRALRS